MADNTNPWTALFGSVKLSNHKGEPVDPTSFTSKSGVMLYFSAHWCPPCRGFTPQLVQYYNTHKDQRNFEIVFVSSDKDQSAFDEYWGEMPWLALPYTNRDIKNALSAKYKVQGIPTLVVLDNNAKTITTGGRGKVTSDPEGFPWVPKTFSQIIKGDVLNGKGENISTDTLSSKTALGVYFSAHWCPPCRGFTPKLVETYNKIKAAGKNFEIVFASSDNDEASFKEYFHEMPWLALPYSDKRISELSDLYDVEGIPHLVILDPSTGQIINPNGRSVVEADPEGNEFPWHPKPLNSVETAGGVLNDSACLIYIDSNLSESTKQALNTVATHFFEKWNAEKKEEHPLLFFHGNGAGLSQRVKDFTNLSKVDPVLLILNIPGECKHVANLSGAPSEADFRSYVESFLAGSLAKKGIKE